ASAETRTWSPLIVRNIVHNSGWLLIDRIVRLAVQFVLIAWLARYLGPHQFGLLSYALAFVALFCELTAAGLSGIVVRDLVRHPGSASTTLGSTFFLRLFASSIAVLLAGGLIYLIDVPDPSVRTLVLVLLIGFAARPFGVFDLWF